MVTTEERRSKYPIRYHLCLAVLFFILAMWVFVPAEILAQRSKLDSLHQVLRSDVHDTSKVKALLLLGKKMATSNPDSAMIIANRALELANASKYNKGKTRALLNIGNVHDRQGNYSKALELYEQALSTVKEYGMKEDENAVLTSMGNVYWHLGNFLKALDYYRNALDISRQLRDDMRIGLNLGNIGMIYSAYGDNSKALSFYKQALEIFRESDDKQAVSIMLNNIGIIYQHEHENEKASEHFQRSLELNEELGNQYMVGHNLMNMGEIYSAEGDLGKALEYIQRSLEIRKQVGDKRGIAVSTLETGEIYLLLKRHEDALASGREAARIAIDIRALDIEKDANELMYSAFDAQHRSDSALVFFEKYIALKDSLFGIEKTRQIHDLNSQHEMALLEKEKAMQKSLLEKAETQRNALLLGALLLIILAFVIYRGYRFRKSSSEMLAKAYDGLQRAQKQLVHTEKMATLGQLTAGVAHEIKNPLNFVTNFSTVNEELLLEIQEEKGDQAKLDENISVLLDNTTRIKKHGQRADNIVKSMLMHSRGTAGVREHTDLNALVEEAVDLARHGSPSGAGAVTLQMKLDPKAGVVNAIPAEISRVVLNLVGNALYAARKRVAEHEGAVEAEVTVTTRAENEKAIIMVSDNGSGISASVKEKLFQPFFTTKPTGVGTGLGLSLCWEIITDGHNGTIEVESEEGQGATFTVKLPKES
jgi:two-component system, NtrC family, sensor kinase